MGIVTLDKLRDRANVYPTRLLTRAETSLVLFCAAFHGRQDAIKHLDAGLVATCVDSDAQKLDEMRAIYPRDWTFVCDDVYRFAALEERCFDVVSLDPPTNQSNTCAEMIDLWCALAAKAVILGGTIETHEMIVAPKGWRKLTPLHRSTYLGGIYWTPLRREAP